MYYSKKELLDLGFRKVGKNVNISRLTKFYSFSGIIGDNTRIDDYSILKGNIIIGRNVHISSFNYLASVGGLISIGDYTGVSARVSIFSVSDDYIGDYMTNPTVDKKFRKTIKGKVIIGKNVSIGAGSVILPNIKLGHSVSIGAQSLVSKNINSGFLFVSRGKEFSIKVKNLKKIKKKIKNFEKLNTPV